MLIVWYIIDDISGYWGERSFVLLLSYIITPFLFLISIVKDFLGKGSKYDISLFNKHEIKNLVITLLKKLVYNFYISFGVLSIFFFFTLLFGGFEKLTEGDFSISKFLVSNDLFIIILFFGVIYNQVRVK